MRTFEISSSGAEETRTLYLIAASDALSQVSYDPVCESRIQSTTKAQNYEQKIRMLSETVLRL